jgi:hypothetical protein
LIAATPLAAPYLAPVVSQIVSGGSVPVGTILLLSAGLILIGFIVAYFGSLYAATLYVIHSTVAVGSQEPLGALLYRGWKSAGHLLTVSVLRGLAILLGFILLIIPGILFSVWFTFVPIIAVLDGGDVDAFKTSKDLVTTRFWPVVGRLVLFSLLYVIPQTILREISPVAGSLWILTAPFFGLLMMLLYFDVKQASPHG